MKVAHNIARLRHLMKMYRISAEELLEYASNVGTKLKTPLNEEDVFGNEIKVSHLKRIDKLFEKGLHYYLDPKAPETAKEASVFFRKEQFATDELNLGARKIVNQFEEIKLSLSAIAKLSDVEIKRVLPKYSIENDARKVASEIRNHLYPAFTNNRRDFLKSMIAKFAEQNILVFEFVETWNKKEKANIDGFFLKPNVIVLKRHQSFRREIFTLAHELGHYLLDEEEIERIEYSRIANRNIPVQERWCNDFAYHFLVGDYAATMDSLDTANANNDYHIDTIEQVSRHTHLSEIALFTRLLYQRQISNRDYNLVRDDYKARYQKKQEEKEREKQLAKEEGRTQRGSVAKPIPSPLYVSTIQSAFYEGVLNEYEVCKRLNIKPEKFDLYIQ